MSACVRPFFQSNFQYLTDIQYHCVFGKWSQLTVYRAFLLPSRYPNVASYNHSYTDGGGSHTRYIEHLDRLTGVKKKDGILCLLVWHPSCCICLICIHASQWPDILVIKWLLLPFMWWAMIITLKVKQITYCTVSLNCLKMANWNVKDVCNHTICKLLGGSGCNLLVKTTAILYRYYFTSLLWQNLHTDFKSEVWFTKNRLLSNSPES